MAGRPDATSDGKGRTPPPLGRRSAPRQWRTRLARLWFWGSIAALVFGGGMYSGWSKSFPFDLARRAVKTGVALWSNPAAKLDELVEWDVRDVAADSLQARRVRLAEAGTSLGGTVLAVGGPKHYRERCPETGACAAVEFSGQGEVVRAWPFDARALLEAGAAGASLGHEVAFGVESAEALGVMSVAPFQNGDLLVVLIFLYGHYPSYYGMARIDGEGRALWVRRDYSHHEPLVATADTVWVPGMTLAEGPVKAPPFVDLPCDDVTLDVIRAVDGAGRIAKEMPLLDIVVGSRWAPVLHRPSQPCDPFHLNSIAFVQEDVSGLPGVLPGDFVLSLKNLDAFAVVGRESGELKRWVRGSFDGQHSVRHLGGSKFILFDNRFAFGRAPPEGSRVLIVDAATGEETTLFPRDLDRFAGWHSFNNGRISLSPDATRVLASYSRIGRGVEIRLEDGAVLAEFDDLHDVRGVPGPQDRGVGRWLWTRYLYRDEGRQ